MSNAHLLSSTSLQNLNLDCEQAQVILPSATFDEIVQSGLPEVQADHAEAIGIQALFLPNEKLRSPDEFDAITDVCDLGQELFFDFDRIDVTCVRIQAHIERTAGTYYGELLRERLCPSPKSMKPKVRRTRRPVPAGPIEMPNLFEVLQGN